MRAILILTLTGGALLAGCRATQKQSSRADASLPPISNTDPCATRLHDISGAFLLYHLMRHDLPKSLDQLVNLPGGDGAQAFECPASHQRYVYIPEGIFLPEQNARVILYDPAPSHSGYRWAITIADPIPGEALVTKVIALPESFFLLRPPVGK